MGSSGQEYTCPPFEWDASLLQGYPPPTELYICQHTQSHTAVTLAWAQA